MRSSLTRSLVRFQLLPGLALVLAVLAAAGAATARPTPEEQAQRTHAQLVLGQVQALNARLGHVVQAWDGAKLELAATQRRVRENRIALKRAKKQLAVARRRLARLLVLVYKHGMPSTVEVIIGATSLQDLVDRVQAAQVVVRQDGQIAAAAAVAARRYATRARALARAEKQRRTTVTRLAAARARIQAGLAQRQRLLASIRTQIARLEAQQRARERRLAIEARARMARMEQRLAAARARARAASAATPAAATTTAAPAVAAAAATAPTPAPAPAPETTTAEQTTGAAPAPQTTTGAQATVPTAAPPSSASEPAPHPEAASIAARYLGVPYRWGGESPAGFDCSGLVSYVYAQLGIPLPHYTVAQWNASTPIPARDMQPGDLVFFYGLDHVGIYIGNGQFIHAPETGDVVKVSTLTGTYAGNFDGARRP